MPPRTDAERARARELYHNGKRDRLMSRRTGHYRRMLDGARRRSRVKGLPTDLDLEFIAELVDRQGDKCAVTGIPFRYTSRKFAPWSPSLDRIDCSEGYTRDNCQVVVYMYNVARNTNSFDEVLEFAQALVNRYCH